jgi:hypothetical protein
VTETGFDVIWPSGTISYPTRRQLIFALYNRGQIKGAKDPGVSFDRYFVLGRWTPRKDPPIVTTLELFGQGRSKPQPKIQVPLGIDLAKRGHEVRKILFAGFGYKISRAGYDPDDVLQEVYKGILARNQGVCPFNPDKSSFGHYVFMVCNCVLANYHRRECRRLEVEQVGLSCALDDERDVDASLQAVDDGLEFSYGTLQEPDAEARAVRAIQSLRGHLITQDAENAKTQALASQILPLLYQGYGRKDIARTLSISPVKVTQAMTYLRSHAPSWASQQG